MMADKEMPHHGPPCVRETFNGIHRAVHGVELHHDMAEQLSFRRVPDRSLITEFIQFSHVMQNRRSKQRIQVQLRIVRGGSFAQSAEAGHVL